MKIEIDETTLRQTISILREAKNFCTNYAMLSKLRITAETLEWHLPEAIEAYEKEVKQ